MPQTDEEKDIAEEEAKIYVSGRISFIKDDPGRQQIGSFNPLTDDDWTEMAYIGNTARLCQAIVDEDVEHVQDWLSQEGADPNTRDHTGRTPLHLAVMSSSPEVVRALIEAGARLTARLADGRTALHLAASRGDLEIIKILMNKSNTNEEEFEELEDQRRKARAALREQKTEKMDVDEENKDDSEDIEMIEADDAETDADKMSIATGSFVKVDKASETPAPDGTLPAEDEEGPDFYDVNQVAWDIPCSALHFAILEGHDEVVKLLCQEYGADVLLPVKFLNDNNTALLTLVLVMALPIEKAKSMAQTLLNLGATVAQADMNSCTVFNRYVERNARTLLDLAYELDKSGYKTAINHVLCNKWSQSNTPLLTAIRDGNLGMVVKLLETGALAEIDFDTWLKSARQSAMQGRLSDFESNKKLFEENVDRPLIAALQSEEPSIALELLERGCDPNTLHPDSARALHNQYSSRWKGKSALDMVRSQLRFLRKYKGETKTVKEPKKRLGLDTYLERFKEGTYQHWAVCGAVELAKSGEENKWKEYEKGVKCLARTKGIPEKEQAIRDAIAKLEKIEESIVSKGGKTFKELYPDRKENGNDDSSSSRNGYYGYNRGNDNSEEEPYEYKFTFNGVQDMTETKQAAYMELFQAVWDGDLDKVKKFTLTSWDDAKEQPPLKIAVEGHNGHNPFTLAVHRGHYDLAKAVLEIAQAQYSPPEKTKTRYTMNKSGEVDDDDDEDDDSCSDTSGPRIVGEAVNDQFTIETIGQVSMQVESHTLPVSLLKGRTAGINNWMNRQAYVSGEDTWDPLMHAVKTNDLKLLKFVLDMGERFGSLQLDPATEPPKFFSVPDEVFGYAINHGRIEVMAELIRRTGSGLPLEHLVEGSGVELKEQPRYYQGLSVYGKKRKDWANAGREVAEQPRDENSTTSPLLRAAEARCIESIQWFLSDAPLRLYLEFAKSKGAQEDARMQHLGRAPGGLEGAIARWLDDQGKFPVATHTLQEDANKHTGELIIHAVITNSGRDDVSDLVSYLIKACPQALDAKSTKEDSASPFNNETPLMQAVYLGRIELVKLLLEAGADPNVKTSSWRNILHAALLHRPPADKLKELLSLFDREAVIRMITERSSLSSDGRTPLHQWLQSIGVTDDHDRSIAVFDLLVEMSSEAVTTALNLLNASGDTPLHDMLKSSYPCTKMIRAVLDFQPSLLFRENAVGRTPIEVVHDELISSRVTPDNQNQRYYRSYGYGKEGYRYLLDLKPKQFLANQKSDQEKWSREHVWQQGNKNDHNAQMWDLCQEYLAKLSDSTPPPSSRSASPPVEGEGETTQAQQARAQSPPKRRKLTTETEGRLNAHVIAVNKLKEKRTLVSLPEANDVAKRLGEMKMGSKYTYQLAPENENENENGQEEVQRFADDETPFASKPDSRTWGDGVRYGGWRRGVHEEKKTSRKTYHANGNVAWKELKKSDEPEEESEGWSRCKYCEQYHKMSGKSY